VHPWHLLSNMKSSMAKARRFSPFFIESPLSRSFRGTSTTATECNSTEVATVKCAWHIGHIFEIQSTLVLQGKNPMHIIITVPPCIHGIDSCHTSNLTDPTAHTCLPLRRSAPASRLSSVVCGLHASNDCWWTRATHGSCGVGCLLATRHARHYIRWKWK
jgi:hypothetical protein